MVGQTEEPGYVMVAEKEGSDDIMELPQEKDGTVLLSTVQAQFPNAIGLKYKSSTGGWRGIRAADNILDPPGDGWGEITYLITESSALKRKSTGGNTGLAEKSKRSPSMLEDMIVLGLPYSTTEEELNTFFKDTCGELAFHEIKRDRDTGRSRGFGFIRFKTEEGAKEALNGQHSLQGRLLKVRLSKKKDDKPTKLFVGRLPAGATQEDTNEYFSEFGELIDVFVPNPFRGFGFITYASQDDAANVLRMNHVMKGARLNVTPAEAKKDKVAGRPDNNGASNWNANSHPSDNWSAPPVQTSRYQEPPVQKDVASELKDILLSLIQSRN